MELSCLGVDEPEAHAGYTVRPNLSKPKSTGKRRKWEGSGKNVYLKTYKRLENDERPKQEKNQRQKTVADMTNINNENHSECPWSRCTN